jgi:hypothetical protein
MILHTQRKIHSLVHVPRHIPLHQQCENYVCSYKLHIIQRDWESKLNEGAIVHSKEEEERKGRVRRIDTT